MTRIERSQFEWKGFTFPASVIDFTLTEDAKVATYPYAGRNGAEHERVLDFRKFKISGIFVYNYYKSDDSIADAPTPLEYVEKLRELNDNTPGVFHHKQIGRFTCILKSLNIKQNGSDGDWYDNSFRQNFAFDIEFWEHISPEDEALVSSLELLAAAPNPKPPNAFYVNRLEYNNADDLYLAIKNGDIVPGTSEELNRDWLQYDFTMRQEAYYKWLEFQQTGQDTVSVETSKYTYYTVQAGDWAFSIAQEFDVTVEDLFDTNKDRTVRDFDKGEEQTEWKTPRRLYPGDRLLIPVQSLTNTTSFAGSNDESTANLQGTDVVTPTSSAEKDLTGSTNTPPVTYGTDNSGVLGDPTSMSHPDWPYSVYYTSLPDSTLQNNLYT